MRTRALSLVVALTLFVGAVAASYLQVTPSVSIGETAFAAEIVPSGTLALNPIGTYKTGVFDEGAAEIVTHDPVDQKLYITNADENSIRILSITDPTSPTLISTINLSSYGAGVNSADFEPTAGLLAVAVEADPKTAPGTVVTFDRAGNQVNTYPVGALPDMLTFTPDGKYILVANEGEPDTEVTPPVDPEGSVSVIDVTGGTVATATFTAFNGREDELRARGVRIFPDKTVAQDVEPEYIAVTADGKAAAVTLQEANALGIVDLNNPAAPVIVDIVPLGLKDHSLAGNAFDASDDDNKINLQNWPVYGMYMPDAIATFTASDATYFVTANEGDDRGEPERIADLTLDTTVFTNAATLQADENLGRLAVSPIDGDLDSDGDYDQLFAYGSRSFTVWDGSGNLVYDSGDEFERITAAIYPANFNATHTENDFDSRSDAKGPEPEGITTGVINGRTYAFIGLERISGVMVYDVTDPTAPVFVQYVNNRDFNGDPEAGTAGDLGPEGLIFITAADSPTDNPLLVVTNEVSGSTTIYEITSAQEATTLTLLHNNDGESSLLPITYSVPRMRSGWGDRRRFVLHETARSGILSLWTNHTAQLN